MTLPGSLPVTASPRPRPAALPAALLAGLLALLLYVATGSRGVEWQDSGTHQYRIITGQIGHPVGLALTPPLHYWLGRGILHLPIGEPAYRLNLLSAICGATGVGLLAALVVQLTRNRYAAALAALALGLSHAYWQMSAVTETYTLACALMLAEWLLLLR